MVADRPCGASEEATFGRSPPIPRRSASGTRSAWPRPRNLPLRWPERRSRRARRRSPRGGPQPAFMADDTSMALPSGSPPEFKVSARTWRPQLGPSVQTSMKRPASVPVTAGAIAPSLSGPPTGNPMSCASPQSSSRRLVPASDHQSPSRFCSAQATSMRPLLTASVGERSRQRCATMRRGASGVPCALAVPTQRLSSCRKTTARLPSPKAVARRSWIDPDGKGQSVRGALVTSGAQTTWSLAVPTTNAWSGAAAMAAGAPGGDAPSPDSGADSWRAAGPAACRQRPCKAAPDKGVGIDREALVRSCAELERQLVLAGDRIERSPDSNVVGNDSRVARNLTRARFGLAGGRGPNPHGAWPRNRAPRSDVHRWLRSNRRRGSRGWAPKKGAPCSWDLRARVHESPPEPSAKKGPKLRTGVARSRESKPKWFARLPRLFLNPTCARTP